MDDNNNVQDTTDIGLGIASLEYGSYTQAGTADRFIAVYGDTVRWVKKTNDYFLYNEETGLWEQNDIYAAADKVVEMSNDIEQAMMQASSDNQAESIGKYVSNLRKIDYVRASVLFAKTRLKCEINDFDANPEIIGLPNCKVLNVVTGEIMDASPEYMITRRLNGTPKDTVSDQFKHYIEVFMPEKDVREYFQMYCGSALVGTMLRNASDKKILMIDNAGNTGKSTFLTALQKAMGDYYTPSKIGILTEKDTGGNSPDTLLDACAGSRLVGISECPDDATFAADRFKQLCGNDMQVVRKHYGKSLHEFEANFRVIIMSNVLPKPDKADDVAFRSRFRRISRTNPLSEIDGHARQYVSTQEFIDDMVTWLYQGCKMYLERDGVMDDYDGANLKECNLPNSMKVAISQYVGENDIMADFFKAYYVRGSDKVKTPCCEMLKDYIEYSNERNISMERWMRMVRAAIKRFGGDLHIERKWCAVEGSDGMMKSRNVYCVIGIRPVKQEDELAQRKQNIQVVSKAN